MAETTYSRRLRALLHHLDLTPAEFAAKSELTEGYVSKILNGTLGKGGELPKLHHKTQAVFGVPDIYWRSRSDIPPEKAHASAPEKGGAYMGRMVGPQSFGSGVDVREALATLAAERDEDGEVIKELLRSQAPEGADAMWWFRRYLELSDTRRER